MRQLTGRGRAKAKKLRRAQGAGGDGVYAVGRVDREILAELAGNARRSAREIGRRLELSTATVISRVRDLEQRGVIKGYGARFDHEKLGFEHTVVTEITVAKGRLLELEREVAKLPQVCAVYDVTGMTDTVVIAKCRSRDELSHFTKKLLRLPFVERTNTHFVLNTVKEDFSLV